jgi:hypothetical protein
MLVGWLVYGSRAGSVAPAPLYCRDAVASPGSRHSALIPTADSLPITAGSAPTSSQSAIYWLTTAQTTLPVAPSGT